VSSLIPWAAIALALATVPLEARALWYDLGHRIVARIAEARLTPQAKAAVRDILGGQSLADASVWADNIRQYRHDADALHYVNIPLSATTYDSTRDCPHRRCIIAAIVSDTQILANPAASPADRAEALRFLVHFVGDLHQPLHVADNGDRGGNRRTVYLLGDSMNLHRVWDGELLKSLGLSESSYLDQLRREMDTLDLDGLAHGSVVDWALEGHRIAVQHAYRLPPDGRLDHAYVRENRPFVDHALIAAGVRLARLINESLATYRPEMRSAGSLGARMTTDREAAAHVGEIATVVGTVASVFRSPGGSVYVNFGADYPRQTFTAVALAPLESWAKHLDELGGQRVRVRGEIVNYRGRIEIVLKSRDQIRLETDSQGDRAKGQ
jgi:hypothetical protein